MTWAYPFDHDHGLTQAELAALVGGKGANLAIMTTELGLPVPPGFTITTEACKAYLADGWPARLDEELKVHIGRIEAAVGRRFGDPADPLLVSVRSGAPVSMPGMLDTILNLGLNAETTPGLAAASGDEEFASGWRRCTGTSSGWRPCPRTRGCNCGTRSRPSSVPGTAPAPSATARRKASPLTWARP